MKELDAAQIAMMDASYRDPIIERFGKADLITGKSGDILPFYIDFKSIHNHPDLRDIFLNSTVQELEKYRHDIDVIGGVQSGGASYASMIADRMKMGYAWARSDIKPHGIPELISGANVSGKNVCLGEDNITSSGSVMSDVQIYREHGAIVKYCFVGSVRTYEALETLEKENIQTIFYIGPDQVNRYLAQRWYQDIHMLQMSEEETLALFKLNS